MIRRPVIKEIPIKGIVEKALMDVLDIKTIMDKPPYGYIIKRKDKVVPTKN